MQSRSVPGREALDDRPAEPMPIVVSGAPGSGKTTLARRIADELALPVISRDAIKEALADAVGPPRTIEESSRLGAAAYAAMFALAHSNFRRGRAERELVDVAAGRRVRVIHCEADPAVIERRYVGRASTRHRSHLDQLRTGDILTELADGCYDPLAIPGAKVLVIDTSDEEMPAIGPIRTFLSSTGR